MQDLAVFLGGSLRVPVTKTMKRVHLLLKRNVICKRINIQTLKISEKTLKNREK